MIAADGPGEYPVITESRAGNDALGVTLTPGTVAYLTTGGFLLSLHNIIYILNFFLPCLLCLFFIFIK